MSNNYPPGVTGFEPQIVGGDDDELDEVDTIAHELVTIAGRLSALAAVEPGQVVRVGRTYLEFQAEVINAVAADLARTLAEQQKQERKQQP